MTYEEAISLVGNIPYKPWIEITNKEQEAINIAIEALEKLVKERKYDWHIVNIHEYSDALSYDEYDYPPNGIRVIFTTGSEEFMGVHSNALNMWHNGVYKFGDDDVLAWRYIEPYME